MKESIKAVVFDLDDTLYNEKDFVYGAFLEVALYLSKKYNLKHNELYKYMIEILNIHGRGKIFNIICEKYGLNEDIQYLIDRYRNAKPKLSLYEDSIELLNKLKGKYKLGLITDGMASVQWNKIKALHIEHYFDKIIVSDDLGKEYWKPHIKTYELMAQELKVSKEECIYVGDNPNKDFYGAKKCGYKTIRLIRKEGSHINIHLDKEYEGDYIVDNIMDITKFL
jgi:putative hydrolase of the HAD superfamily